MKILIDELDGQALNLAVIRCLGMGEEHLVFCNPAYQWSEGGLIIESHRISLIPKIVTPIDELGWHGTIEYYVTDKNHVTICSDGKTPLIAAMRVFVKSKSFPEFTVDIP